MNIAQYTSDADLISRVRPARREYLSRLFSEGKLRLAGPYLDGSGATIIYETDSLSPAHLLATEDPFHYEGVFAYYELKERTTVFASQTIVEKQ